jgi:hypothetical protein
MDGFLVKPLDREQLAALVTGLSEQARAAA